MSSGRTFRERLSDYLRDPDEWEVVSIHSEKAGRKGARRHGTSIQTIYRHRSRGDRLVRHTVTDDHGRVVDDHFRPDYKPRTGDLNHAP